MENVKKLLVKRNSNPVSMIMKKLLVILLLFFPVHGAMGDDHWPPGFWGDTDAVCKEFGFGSKVCQIRINLDRKRVIEEREKQLEREREREQAKRLQEEKEYDESRSWWGKLEDKRDKKYVDDVECAQNSMRAKTDAAAKQMYKSCMKLRGHTFF